MRPKNVWSSLLVVSLELFLQRTSFLPVDELWTKHVEQSFLFIYFHFGIQCFFPLRFQFPSNIFCIASIFQIFYRGGILTFPELLLGTLEGLFRKGFCFFVFQANISVACVFDLAKATRYSLQWYSNKSASSLNIFDCCTGQFRAAKCLTF